MSGNAYRTGSGYYGSWQLWRDFFTETYGQTRSGGGWTEDWLRTGSFEGVLGDANARAIEVASSRQQEVSHQIVSTGSPRAFPGDRIVAMLGGRERYFYIQNVEDPGAVGKWSIYDVMEGDIHGS